MPRKINTKPEVIVDVRRMEKPLEGEFWRAREAGQQLSQFSISNQEIV